MFVQKYLLYMYVHIMKGHKLIGDMCTSRTCFVQCKLYTKKKKYPVFPFICIYTFHSYVIDIHVLMFIFWVTCKCHFVMFIFQFIFGLRINLFIIPFFLFFPLLFHRFHTDGTSASSVTFPSLCSRGKALQEGAVWTLFLMQTFIHKVLSPGDHHINGTQGGNCGCSSKYQRHRLHMQRLPD